MIVQCDKCGAKFQLADDKITEKGAKVRCSKCKSVFVVKKSGPATGPASEAKPSSSSASSPPARGGPSPGGDRPSAPPPSPAKTTTPQASPPSSAAEPDPFTDFNFDDQLDFGEEEKVTVAPAQRGAAPPSIEPPPAPAVGPKFMDDSSAVSWGGDASEEKGAEEGGFDFSDDEDFSFSEEAAPAKAPPPATAVPPAAADDFGDFKFDEDSFTQTPSTPSPPVAEEEWGNVSLGPAKEKPGVRADQEETDDTGFGDFQFDTAESPSRPSADDDLSMDLAQDFVRAPGSKAPVRDDLEAAIGETELPPEREPERKVKPLAEPPPPPKIQHRAEGTPGWLIGLIILLVLAAAGGGGYFFRDQIKTYFHSSRPIVSPTAERLELVGKPEIKPYTRTEDGQQSVIIVARGRVKNTTSRNQRGVLVRLKITYTDDSGSHEMTGQSYWCVSFTDEELKGAKSRRAIEIDMDTASGQNAECLDVPPGEEKPYTIVFFLPEIAGKINIVPGEPEIVVESGSSP